VLGVGRDGDGLLCCAPLSSSRRSAETGSGADDDVPARDGTPDLEAGTLKLRLGGSISTDVSSGIDEADDGTLPGTDERCRLGGCADGDGAEWDDPDDSGAIDCCEPGMEAAGGCGAATVDEARDEGGSRVEGASDRGASDRGASD